MKKPREIKLTMNHLGIQNINRDDSSGKHHESSGKSIFFSTFLPSSSSLTVQSWKNERANEIYELNETCTLNCFKEKRLFVQNSLDPAITTTTISSHRGFFIIFWRARVVSRTKNQRTTYVSQFSHTCFLFQRRQLHNMRKKSVSF